MKIIIASIGKFKSGPESDLYQHYLKRLPWSVTLKELDTKKMLESERRKTEEATLLLAACKDADHIIALDEKGKQMGSKVFAAHFQKRMDSGDRTLAFIIGGADGLDDSVRKKAHLLLSLGMPTWPHLLVRGLLAEQLYRAHSIMNSHPYHRE